MKRISQLRRIFSSCSGQTMAEYGLILAGICLLALGAMVALNTPVSGLISGVVNAFP